MLAWLEIREFVYKLNKEILKVELHWLCIVGLNKSAKYTNKEILVLLRGMDLSRRCFFMNCVHQKILQFLTNSFYNL